MANKIKLGKNVNCSVCNKEFYCTPARLQKSKTICCSLKCSSTLIGDRLRKRIEVNCVICNKVMYRKASQHSRVKFPSCSEQCKAKVKKLVNKGDNNPNSLKLSELDRFLHDRASECNRRAMLNGNEGVLSGEILRKIYDNQNGKCYYSGVQMTFGTRKCTNFSVDRVDSSKGYTEDNIVLCSLAMNYMKNNFNIEDINNLIKSIHSKKGDYMVNIKIVNESGFELKPSTLENSGTDLFTRKIEDCGEYIKVFTGVKLQPEKGYYFDLLPRSSTHKQGLILYNNTGVIDQSYTGEIIGIFYKTNDFKVLPEIGSRLLQVVLRRCYEVEFEVVESLEKTERGDKGFGSSGSTGFKYDGSSI